MTRGREANLGATRGGAAMGVGNDVGGGAAWTSTAMPMRVGMAAALWDAAGQRGGGAA